MHLKYDSKIQNMFKKTRLGGVCWLSFSHQVSTSLFLIDMEFPNQGVWVELVDLPDLGEDSDGFNSIIISHTTSPLCSQCLPLHTDWLRIST